MTTGKTIALTRQTFVGKVISLLFNTLSRFAAYHKRVGFSKLRMPPLQHLPPHAQMSSLSLQCRMGTGVQKTSASADVLDYAVS